MLKYPSFNQLLSTNEQESLRSMDRVCTEYVHYRGVEELELELKLAVRTKAFKQLTNFL